MVSLAVLFWLFIFIFSLIGAIRGWAKEIVSTFSVILALFIITVLEKFVPAVNTYLLNSPPSTQMWFKVIITLVLVFCGYQTPNLPAFVQTQRFNRDRFQDVLLGFFAGAFNGYLIFGTIWFFMHQANYPFPVVLPPIAGTPAGEAALRLIPLLAPNWLAAPVIYFAIAAAFVLVLVVFI